MGMKILKTNEEIESAVSLAERTQIGLDKGQTIKPQVSDSVRQTKNTGGEQIKEYTQKKTKKPFGIEYAFNANSDTGIDINLYYNDEYFLEEFQEHVDFQREGQIYTDAKRLIEQNKYVAGAKLKLGNDHFIPFEKEISEGENQYEQDQLEGVFREIKKDNGVSIIIQNIFHPIEKYKWNNRISVFGSLTPSKLATKYKEAERDLKDPESSISTGSIIRTKNMNEEVILDNLSDTQSKINRRVVNSSEYHYASNIRVLVASNDKKRIKGAMSGIKQEYKSVWGDSGDLKQQFLYLDPASNIREIEQIAVDCRQRKSPVNKKNGLLRNPYKVKLLHKKRTDPMILHPDSVAQLGHIPSQRLDLGIEITEKVEFGGFDEEELG